MRFTEIVRGVLLSISTNKFRSFLTSLGIIIGTFTIIMVVGIGKASEAAVGEQYKRLSVESITISRSGNMMRPGVTSKSLTKDDAMLMPEYLDNVRAIGISTSTSSSIVYGSASKTITVQGTNADFAYVTNLNPAAGEFYTDEDGSLRNRVAVLGYNVAKELFGEDTDFEDIIGEKVTIKGASFNVVGVLDRIGGTGGISGGRDGSADDMAFIPYEVALKYTTGSIGTRGGGGMVMISSSSQITFIALANDIASVKPAIAEIKEYIEEVCGENSGYSVTDVGSTLSSALETSNTMAALLIAVAAIVMIVSGIGIMNVLMVAVKERTREIGILKSIGAARRVILFEFLLEAVFISVMGGLLGVLLSYYAPAVLAYSSIEYLASVEGLVLGLGFSVLTGIFFGYYPASKASKLKPIDALNME